MLESPHNVIFESVLEFRLVNLQSKGYIITTSKATASVASTATSTAFSSIVGVSIVDLDLLTIDDGSVQFLDGHGSTVVVSHCHEGITLFGDVHISDISASGEKRNNEIVASQIYLAT